MRLHTTIICKTERSNLNYVKNFVQNEITLFYPLTNFSITTSCFANKHFLEFWEPIFNADRYSHFPFLIQVMLLRNHAHWHPDITSVFIVLLFNGKPVISQQNTINRKDKIIRKKHILIFKKSDLRFFVLDYAGTKSSSFFFFAM